MTNLTLFPIPRYRVYTYDPITEELDDGFAWQTFARQLTAREAVQAVRELESRSYDREASIMVEREDA